MAVGRRSRVWLALGAVVAVVGLAVVVADDPADEPTTVRVASGDSAGSTVGTDPTGGSTTTWPTPEAAATDGTTTTSTGPPPTSTTVRPSREIAKPPTDRRLVELARDPAQGWTLFTTAKGCIELEAQGQTFGDLLCGAPATARPAGDLVTLDVGGDRILIAIVDPAVSGFDVFPAPQGGGYGRGTVVAHPDRPGVAYLIDLAVRAARFPATLLLRSADNKVGRLELPAGPRTIAADQLDLVTTAPYGNWSAYRHGGQLGLVFGGLQEYGFFDGPAGAPCVLYRRFLNHETVFLDTCAPARVGGTVAHVVTVSDPAAGPGRLLLLAVFDGPVDDWRCETADGKAAAPSVRLGPDPKGTGRSFGASSVTESVSPDSSLTCIALLGGKEVDRVTVRVGQE